MPQPDPQVDLGLALLSRAKNPEAIASAAGMFGESLDPRIRQALTEKYHWLDAEPRRRDSGCFQRTALVRAFRGRAMADDISVMETALWTVEVIGRFDSASELRAAALVTLNEIDAPLAAFHATRLLSDAHEMSGQPAVTAARLLAGRDELLPLYGMAATGGGQADVLAECLRGLAGLPLSLTIRLIDRYRQEKDETILLGLFDLVLGHPSRSAFAELIAGFLKRTQSIELYAFVANSIVATRDETLVAILRDPDGPSKDSPKGKVVAEALALIPT